jgi:hypothetical protein
MAPWLSVWQLCWASKHRRHANMLQSPRSKQTVWPLAPSNFEGAQKVVKNQIQKAISVTPQKNEAPSNIEVPQKVVKNQVQKLINIGLHLFWSVE